MPEMESVVKTRLDTHSGLGALISDRIYGLVLPQNPTYPAVTYQRIDTDPMEGMTQDHGITDVLFQVDVWAATYPSAKSVSAQVRTCMKRHTDAATDPVWLDTFLENELDDYEPNLESGEGVFRVIHTYKVQHRE